MPARGKNCVFGGIWKRFRLAMQAPQIFSPEIAVSNLSRFLYAAGPQMFSPMRGGGFMKFGVAQAPPSSSDQEPKKGKERELLMPRVPLRLTAGNQDGAEVRAAVL